MSTSLRFHRRHNTSRRFRLECLESRFVLSTAGSSGLTLPAMLVAPLGTDPSNSAPLGPDLTIVGISPSDGAKVTTSPNTLGVIFDRPIDPFSLGIGDIRVDQLQSDNTWLPVLNDGVTSLDESVDDSGTILQLTLNSSLPVGTYRLVLPAYSMIAGLDGTTFADVSNDLDLGHFTMAQQGVTLKDAVDIGPVTLTSPGVGNSTSSWSAGIDGSLDFNANPLAVNLYKITVPAGHFWRLGAEVESQRLGGSLESALTVFDSQGNVVRFSNAGRSSSPNDAYLYTGLGPGTYYIGVSGTRNIPAPSYHGYDVISGDPGTVVQSQAGGSYTLELSLDTADQPTELVQSSLDYADPLDTTPTGLTLVFNEILDAQSVRGQPTPGFVLTNQAGQTFPLTIVNVDEATGKYTFLFDNTLPAGDYTLMIAGNNGAKDLAGLTPVAANHPQGVMMTFHVKASTANSDPYNVGAFNNNIHQGVRFEASINPGESTTWRFVLTSDGVYQFGTSFATGQIEVQILGGGSPGTWYPAGTAGVVGGFDYYYKAGVYLISFRNVGSAAADFHWMIRLNQAWDSFFDNGIGQSSAMTLRQVDPSAAGSSGQPILAPSGPVIIPTSSGPNSPQGGGAVSPSPGESTPSTLGSTSSPAVSSTGHSSLVVTFGDTLVGRPTHASDHVTVANSDAASGIGGLASAGNGIPQGIGVGQGLASTSLRLSRLGRNPRAAVANPGPEELPPVNGAIVFEPVAAPPKADEMVVASGNWLERLGELAARFLSPRDSGHPAEIDDPGEVEAIAMSRDDSPRHEGKVESADLGTPAAIGLFTMATVRQFNKTRKRKGQFQTGHPSVIRGPHGRF